MESQEEHELTEVAVSRVTLEVEGGLSRMSDSKENQSKGIFPMRKYVMNYEGPNQCRFVKWADEERGRPLHTVSNAPSQVMSPAVASRNEEEDKEVKLKEKLVKKQKLKQKAKQGFSKEGRFMKQGNQCGS
jgi:hypothetical protein